jgi:hypothetical protein
MGVVTTTEAAADATAPASLLHEIVKVVSDNTEAIVCDADFASFVPDSEPHPFPATQEVALVELHCNVTESPDETEDAEGVRLADGDGGRTLTVTLLVIDAPFIPRQVIAKPAVEVKGDVAALPYLLVLVDHPDVLQELVL